MRFFSRNLSKSTVNFSRKKFSPFNVTFPRNVLTTVVPSPRYIFTTGIFRFGETIDTLYFNVLKYKYAVDYVVVDDQYNYLNISKISKSETRKGSVYIEMDDIDELLKGLNYMVQSSSKEDSISIKSVAMSNKTYRVVRSSFRVEGPTPKTVNTIIIEESKPNASEAPYMCTIYEKAWIPVINNISTMANRHSSKNKPHNVVSPRSTVRNENEPHNVVSPRSTGRNENEPHNVVSPRNTCINENEPQAVVSPRSTGRNENKPNTYRNETSNVGKTVDTLTFSVLEKKYFVDCIEINKHRKLLKISETKKGRKVSIWIEKDDVVELLKGLHYMAQDSPRKGSITIHSVSNSEKTYQVSRGSFGNQTRRNFIEIKEFNQDAKGGTFTLRLGEPGWIPAIIFNFFV